MRLRYIVVFAIALVAVGPSACTTPPRPAEESDARTASEAITSVEASILDFGFAGETIAEPGDDARDAINKQLLYMFGILRTNDGASGQIGNVRLADVTEKRSGKYKRIAYKAWLPVAWPKDATPPASYDLAFPRDVTALDSFDSKYDGRCGKNEHGQANFWHDWNPRARDCSLDDDVIRATAVVGPHTEAEKRYPEYDRIWADERLDVTAIFTIIESPDRPNDWAYVEAQGFIRHATEKLQDVTIEHNSPSSSILWDTTITGRTMVGGAMRDVGIDVLVINTVTDAGSDFDDRYDPLSERADLILFNGHARLGANTTVLGHKGRVVPGKYQIVLLNACDSFALVDTTMTDRRREANGERADPEGTRFLDVITNARPGRSDNLANVSLEVYKAALQADDPMSYSAIIAAMPKEHVVVVYGEEDNTFRPAWAMSEAYAEAR